MSAKWDVSKFGSWSSADYPLGAVCLEGGNARDYLTGGWRAKRPVWDGAACKNCLLCWVACPDSSILVTDGQMSGIDYDHCKGCGVCVGECKFGALELVLEADAKEAEAAGGTAPAAAPEAAGGTAAAAAPAAAPGAAPAEGGAA